MLPDNPGAREINALQILRNQSLQGVFCFYRVNEIMKTIGNEGLNLVKDFEKLRLTCYNDGYGFPTVGWGHLVKKGEGIKIGDKITATQAEAFLHQDLANAEREVNQKIKAPLTQNQFDALVSLMFNMGSFAKAPTMLKLVNAKNYESAANAFGRYVKSAGKTSNGLIRRRGDERKLFLTPDSKSKISAAAPAIQPAIIDPPFGTDKSDDSSGSVNSGTLNSNEPPPDNSSVTVNQAVPAKDEAQDKTLMQQAQDLGTQLKSWHISIPTAILTALAAFWERLTSGDTTLVFWLIGIVAALVIIAVGSIVWRKERKDKRAHDLEIEQEITKRQREAQAHELTVLAAKAAMDKSMNNITFAPQPIQNSDS